MSIGAIGLAFLAGILSILSPCVLPLLPLVLGAAASRHRFGPALLALGVAISFVAIGLFVATIGFAIGIDDFVFRFGSAILMILFGIVLVAPPLQERFSAAAGPLSDKIDSAFRGYPAAGALGQFGLGLVLGAVWSSLRRADARRRLGAGGARREFATGDGDHGRLWAWGRAAAFAARRLVAAADVELARFIARRRQARQAGARRFADRPRRADRFGCRQGFGSRSRRRVARLAHAIDDDVLKCFRQKWTPVLPSESPTKQRSSELFRFNLNRNSLTLKSAPKPR